MGSVTDLVVPVVWQSSIRMECSRRPFFAVLPVFCESIAAATCEAPAIISQASTPGGVLDFFVGDRRKVLTLLGYSGADYQDKATMLADVARLLGRFDPKTTILNIGATAEGIGAAYEIAKEKGFTTTGVVSAQAERIRATLSPCVDKVFYVKDETWGGLVKGTDQLSLQRPRRWLK